MAWFCCVDRVDLQHSQRDSQPAPGLRHRHDPLWRDTWPHSAGMGKQHWRYVYECVCVCVRERERERERESERESESNRGKYLYVCLCKYVFRCVYTIFSQMLSPTWQWQSRVSLEWPLELALVVPCLVSSNHVLLLIINVCIRWSFCWCCVVCVLFLISLTAVSRYVARYRHSLCGQNY